MELRHYWNVIWKRRWLVLAILLITTAASAYMALTAGLSFEAETRYITRQLPADNEPRFLVFNYDRYYNWFGSEFLVDDYTEIVQSDAFAGAVYELISDTLGSNVTRDNIKNSMEVDRKHRELRVKVVAGSRDQAKRMSEAVAMVLTDARMKPIRGEMLDDRALFAQIDEATTDEIKSSRVREFLNAAIRVIVSLVAALALAFLLEYLDDSVRDERDARRVLDVPVIGAIPRG
jgi:capsular polysaccharide biosynthesis protein